MRWSFFISPSKFSTQFWTNLEYHPSEISSFSIRFIPLVILMFLKKGWRHKCCRKKAFRNRNVFLTTTINLCRNHYLYCNRLHFNQCKKIVKHLQHFVWFPLQFIVKRKVWKLWLTHALKHPWNRLYKRLPPKRTAASVISFAESCLNGSKNIEILSCLINRDLN